MNNDLTGTTSSSRVVPSGTDSTVTPSQPDTSTVTTPGMSVDFKIYSGADIMSSIENVVLQQFSTKGVGTVVDLYADHPVLLEAQESDVGPQPVGSAEQKRILRFFHQRVRQSLEKSELTPEEAKAVYSSFISGNVVSDSKQNNILQNAINQAKKETQEQTPLPTTWDPQSTNSRDWIRQPLQPYNDAKQAEINNYYDKAVTDAFNQYVAQAKPPLAQNQIDTLKKALSDGKAPLELEDAFKAITKTAASATQQTYGLSETWYKGTISMDDWKPINIGPLAPAAVNRTQVEDIISNLNDYLTGLEEAAKKISEGLEPNSTEQVAMDEFRRVISAAIQELKAVLREIQLADAEVSKDKMQSKLDAVMARLNELTKDIQDRIEAEKKQAKAQKVSTVMKIVGPIVAALATIVGAALAIFTFGASLAIVVAGIAIGTAMTAYAIADSVTGCTAKLMTIVNEALEKAYPDNPAIQKAIKFAVVLAIVLVMVAIIIVSGGGAAGSIASSTAVQIAKEVAKQLAIQILIMAVMASNALPELFGAVLKACGVSEKDSQIAEIIMMVITLILLMVAVLAGGKAGAGGAAKVTDEAAATVKDGVTQGVKQGAETTSMTVKEQLKAAMQKVSDMIAELGNKLKNAPNVPKATQEFFKDFLEGFKNIGKGFRNLPKAIEEASQIRKGAMALTEAENLRGTLASSQKVLQLTSAGINVADGINRGVVGMQVAKLLESAGDHQEAAELIKAIIDMLEKMLATIQTGMDSRANWMVDLGNMYNEFINGLERNTSQVFRTLQG